MAATHELSLSSTKNELINLFKESNFEDPSEITNKIPALSPKNAECKSLIDQIFREYLLPLISNCDVEILKKYIRYNIEACRLDLCTSSTPVVLLGDVFDMSTLDFCEHLFTFVETNVNVWKEDLFFGPCKNNLLRMCNDLLRRLSRSQNTVFCGRILLFLAQFFPFSERSGLNIVSEFNVENITDYSNDGDLESLSVEESSDSNDTKVVVDYALYSKFWFLQNFFRCPNDLYIPQKWLMFSTHSKYVLNTLKHYKLDGMSAKSSVSSLLQENENEHRYFAKFLTNQKLLELQLSDSNFRRYVLVQFLILFQYLTSTVKSKPENCKLKPDQVEWIEKTTVIVYDLIKETPPDGPEFSEIVKKILQREERWNNWKNESCPEIKKPNTAFLNFDHSEKPREKFVGDLLRDACAQKKYFMGNPRMTRLWNHKPDNMAACRSKEREFLPSLESYFEAAIMESDPAAMIETQYKKVSDIDFAWRGLRLLSQKCPYFFAQSNNPISKMSDFLENMLNKISKDKPTLPGTAEEKSKDFTDVESQDVIINTDGGEEAEVVNEESHSQEEPMEEESNQKTPPTKEILHQISKVVTSKWQELALKLGYTRDEIEFFAERPGDDGEKRSEQGLAEYVLTIWSEDDDDPSAENLSSILESLEMTEALNILKSAAK